MAKRSQIQIALDKIDAEIEELQNVRERLQAVTEPPVRRVRARKPKAEPPRAVPDKQAS